MPSLRDLIQELQRVDLKDGGDPHSSENLASLCHECHARLGRERPVAVGEGA